MTTDDPSSDDSRFLSLSEVKTAHAEMRKRFAAATKSDDKGASMADEIERFVKRGRATGTVLAESDVRWSCQTILDYWLTKLYDLDRDDVDTTLADFDPETAPELPDELCPYMGLDAFHEDNSHLFVGRKDFTSQLVAKLLNSGLLMVTGSSGGGKSSAVMAGLIPALKSGALPGSEDWIYCRPVVPGDDPVASLKQITDIGEQGDGGGARVIVIDQFEELFTLCEDVEMRRAFSESLLSHVDAGDRIILTIRTDFEPFLGKLPELEARLKDSKIAITPLSAADLRRAIEEPAQKIGLRFEEGVIERLVDDLVGEPAGLPLLQFTLMMLWKRRTRNRITFEAYEALGGGRLALKRSADKLFNEFIPEEQRTARRIFMKLVKPGEGVEVTRRRVPLGELHCSGEAPERIDRVLERLVDAQLIRRIESEPGAPVQLEVVHEALVRNWPTLVDWLDEERHALRNLHKMSAAAEVWHNTGKGDEFLYRGEQLSYTEGKLRDSDYELNPREKEFIQASQELREAEIRKAKRARVVHWVWTIAVTVLSAFALWNWNEAYDKGRDILEQKEVIEGLNATLRKQKAAKPWLDNGIRLDDRGERFEADLVTAAQIDAFPPDEQGRSREILNQTGVYPVWQNPLARHHSLAINAVAVSSDGRFVISGGEEGEVKVWERQTGTVEALSAHDGGVTSIAIDPEGKFFVTAGKDKFIRVWSLESRKLFDDALKTTNVVTTLAFHSGGDSFASGEEFGLIKFWDILADQVAYGVTLDFEGKIGALGFTPDGGKLVVGGSDGNDVDQPIGQLKYWVLTTGEDMSLNVVSDSSPETPEQEGSVLGRHTVPVTSLAFALKGDLRGHMASSDESGTIEIWDCGKLEDGAEPRSEVEATRAVRGLAFSGDGTVLASCGVDASIDLWDTSDSALKKLPQLFEGHRYTVSGARFCQSSGKDGEILVSAGHDGMIKRWNIETGEELPGDLDGMQAPIGAVALSPDGRFLASGRRSGRIDLWDLAEGEMSARPRTLPGHPSGVTRLTFSPSGATLVSGGKDGGIRWWDWRVDGEAALLESSDHAHAGERGVTGLEFSPDGRHLASCGSDQFIRWWDAGAKVSSTFGGEDAAGVTCLAISPDGLRLVSGDNEGSITTRVRETLGDPFILIPSLSAHAGAVASLAFSPDGRQLASGGADSSAIIWGLDGEAPQELRRFSDAQGVINSVRFSADGKTFAIASSDKLVKLWNLPRSSGSEAAAVSEDPEVGSELLMSGAPELNIEAFATLSGYSVGVSDVIFSPDGRSLVSACRDGSLRLWTIRADEPMRFEGLPDEIAFCVSVSPDAKYLVAGGKPSAIAWDLQTGLALGKAFETNATLGLAFARTGSRISAALHGAGVISWVLPSVGDGTQLEDGRGTAEFADPGGPVFCVAGSPAGDQIIASGGDDQVIRLWGAGGKLIGEPLAGHSERITSLAFDASGRILASASKDGTVRLWNISDRGGSARGAPIYNEEGVIIYGIAFDPKSQRLAWGGRWKGNDNRLIVWDLDEGYVADLGGHLAAIRSVAFHPSDNFIVSGAADSKVKIWDLDREQERVELRDHDGVVTGVTFSADGRLLAASSLGSTPVLVWDMKSVFPPDFKLYQSERNPWLQLDKDAYDIRWHSSTDQLDGSGHFDLVNLPPGCHLGILQRSDFDPADPAKNAVLKNEALFGRFLYARNWNSALTMCRQLKADQSTRAAWAREALRQQLKAAAEENPASSAALLRDRLEAE